MPNWCFTNITINHNDSYKIAHLYNLIREWTSKDWMDNGFGNDWLGNVVLGSGVGTVDTNKDTDIRCRGRITDMNFDDNSICIHTETAWSPMLKIWVKVVNKYLPDAELLYSAEEEGNGLFCTNDPSLKDKWIIDSWDIDEVESDWEASRETVIEVLQKLLDTEEINMKILLGMLYGSDYDDGMNIHEWEYCSIGEWD